MKEFPGIGQNCNGNGRAIRGHRSDDLQLRLSDISFGAIHVYRAHRLELARRKEYKSPHCVSSAQL